MFPWFATPKVESKRDAMCLRRIEAKLDRILVHLGLPHDDPPDEAGLSAAVREFADKGQKINAIKAYREQTGVGLREAKDAVEAYMGR